MLEQEAASEKQAELLRRIATQDRAALADFYDQTAGLLFSTAMRIVGDGHEAEEVVQDVFVQIWNKAATFDSALGAPLHWAIGIARNRAIDRLRARQRQARLLEDLTREADPPDHLPGQGESPLSQDELAQVRSAVDHLPPEQRQAIELAFFGGLTHQEIAEKFNEPLGTIKARIRRGMLKLRDTLVAHA